MLETLNQSNGKLEVENTSPASSSTLSYSLTGGMLSVSSASVNIGRPDSGGSGLYFFKDVFRHIVLGYLSQAPVGRDSSASDSRSPPSGTRLSVSHSGSSRQIRPGKRDRGNGKSEDDGQHLRPSKRPKRPPSRSLVKPRFLACPFWKLDPDKHWECFLKKITTVSYVKQHLSRRHTPTLYCQRCLTIFDHAESHHQHVFGEPCTPRPLARLDGISPDQSLQLSKKSKGTTEEQWYAIWGILFPEERRPLSIYVGSDQSPDFVLLREFSQRQGVSILHERIRATGRILRSDVSEQEVVNTLGQALDSLFEYYRLGQDSVQPVPSQTESWSLNTSTPQGGTVDHGSTGSRAVVASHYSHGSNGDDLATTATPDQNNAVTPTADPFMEYQPDPAEPLQVLEVLDTDMPAGGWGPLGEMESFIGGENWDELCNRIIAKGEIPGFDTGVGGGM
ncbi:hypothetical protein BHE90_001449 [Fusarium euwallaceae]|uniref:C2H2-type domain-containing protein n=1 Tax=Fusarium euwallaceae TaxID=1147111 RepID=A0A430M7Y6_9HYPO|nr:hypothetical protein BHE90_001449 [Fusarium euwallaceae]